MTLSKNPFRNQHFLLFPQRYNPLPLLFPQRYNPLPFLGSSNSAANKGMMSKIWTNRDTIS